jgi:hypothetical protein
MSQTGRYTPTRLGRPCPLPCDSNSSSHDCVLDNKLALGYYKRMKKVSKAARELAKLSIAARKRKWGKKGFRERMQAWGKLGGRPKKGKHNAN